MASRTAVKFIFSSFIGLLIGLGILLCLEIGFRMGGRYGLNGIAFSKTEIWRWHPWLSSKTINEDGEAFTSHTDQYGFRNYGKKVKKADNVIRILVLGDSYTEGLAYADDKIFTSLLEKSLGGIKKDGKSIEVIGASSPAWSTEQELRCLQNEALAFEPDYVVLMATPNDIREAYMKKFVGLNSDGTIKFNYIKYRFKEKAYWFMSNYSCFFQYLQKKVLYTNYGTFESLMGHYSFNFGKEDSTMWDRPMFLKSTFPELDSAYHLFYMLIGEMNKTCTERKISFAVSLIPIVEEFNGTMVRDTAIQSGIVSEKLQHYCDSVKIDYIDLYTRFKNDPEPGTHFMRSDFHFNSKGHRATAEGLAAYYRERLQ